MGCEKTLLLTGATGFIGKATLSELIESGWQVTKGVRSSVKELAEGEIYLDLSDPSNILDLAKMNRFNAIVHIAARIGWSGETEAELFVPNVLSTGCLAYLAKHWDVPLIYASAAIVHGINNKVTEADSALCLDTAYAKSKWLGEQLISVACNKFCILRIAGVFGGGGPAHLVLNRAIDGAIKGELPVQIGAGDALRSYVYVKDVAKAIAFVLEKNMTGTHLLAGAESISVKKMLRLICDTFLPGQNAVIKEGAEASNQIVKSSPLLPKSRGFAEALIDIKQETGL